MGNKKNVNQNFLQRFSNHDLRKKKEKGRDEKKGKKKEEPNLLSHSSS